MKLFELNPINVGLWLSPTGEYLKVDTNHARDIISNPSKFGVTYDFIKNLYNKHGEDLRQEGEAREELIRLVLQRGWVRIRNYRNYWSVTVHKLTPKVKDNIRNWVGTFVKREIMGKFADLKILETVNDRLQTVEANDIINFRLEEGVTEMEDYKAINETSFDSLPDIELLTEVKLSRVYEYFTSKMPVGIITAFRGENDLETNTRLNKQLAASLRSAGFGYTWVDGAWIENQGTDKEFHVSEVSILVSGKEGTGEKLFTNLKNAAQQYNQDAFVFKSDNSKKIGIYDKNGNLEMSFDRTRLDKIGDVYTKLRSGSHKNKSFVFEGERDPVGFVSRLTGKTD